jgi:hypothetical protein
MNTENFNLPAQIEAFTKGELDNNATVELVQYLIDNRGLAWTLHSPIGLKASELAFEGLCYQKGHG